MQISFATSPFVLDNMESAVVQVAPDAPTQGGTLPELTEFLPFKKRVVNVKNTDNRSFGSRILASRVILRGMHNRPPDYYDEFVAKKRHIQKPRRADPDPGPRGHT